MNLQPLQMNLPLLLSFQLLLLKNLLRSLKILLPLQMNLPLLLKSLLPLLMSLLPLLMSLLLLLMNPLLLLSFQPL